MVATPLAPRTKRKRSPAKPPPPAGKPWLAVRKDKVARARKLLDNPDYPPPKVLDSVARLLAKHLRQGD